MYRPFARPSSHCNCMATALISMACAWTTLELEFDRQSRANDLKVSTRPKRPISRERASTTLERSLTVKIVPKTSTLYLKRQHKAQMAEAWDHAFEKKGVPSSVKAVARSNDILCAHLCVPSQIPIPILLFLFQRNWTSAQQEKCRPRATELLYPGPFKVSIVPFHGSFFATALQICFYIFVQSRAIKCKLLAFEIRINVV